MLLPRHLGLSNYHSDVLSGSYDTVLPDREYFCDPAKDGYWGSLAESASVYYQVKMRNGVREKR